MVGKYSAICIVCMCLLSSIFLCVFFSFLLFPDDCTQGLLAVIIFTV